MAVILKNYISQQHIEKKKPYELIYFKMCELNFELVHVESELTQHWSWPRGALAGVPYLHF